MFGKPEWFRPKKLGWGLVPVRREGWVYAVVWALVIALPFVWLVERHQGLEAIIWLAAMISLLCWDVRVILRAMHSRNSSDEPSA